MAESPFASLLKGIPSVDRLMNEPSLAALRERYTDELFKGVVRRGLDELREDIRRGTAAESECTIESVSARVERLLHRRLGGKLRTVVNATGVIIHTNLGRSCLSERVIERIAAAARSYSNLEYNLDQGRRGERNSHLRELMEELTGAQAALAVNNNAAAVLLALSSLAAGREVVVSRGELIEIGGAFRIPDVMARSGAILREVGTTNRTHPRDYVEAINERTALILKVHPSNYRIEGFTREVSLDELVRIGRDKNVPTAMDLGSGCLVDLTRYGIEGEVTVQHVVASGVDVVTFSGDKLLGGPQAGIVAGKTELVEKMRTNPLARALRMDKLTLAALEATLEEYTRREGIEQQIPTLGMIVKSADELQQTADTLAATIAARVGRAAAVSIEYGMGRVGGGALPMGDLPGPRVAVRPRNGSAAGLEERLRKGNPPVIALVKDDAVLFDPRTLLHGQCELLPDLVAAACGKNQYIDS